MNHLRAGREGGRLPRDTIVEASADAEEHVALLNRAVDVNPAVHPRHPDAERMIFGKDADALQRRYHGNASAFGERAQLIRGAGNDDAMARQNEGLARARQETRRFAHGTRIDTDRSAESGDVESCVPVRYKTRLLRVLGDVDQYRPGSTRARDVKCLMENARQIRSTTHPIIVLGDWQCDAGDVGLLESVLSQHRARYLARDCYEWRAVHPRVRDRSHEIRRAWSARGDTYAGFSGGARVTFRRVARALFVATQYVAQAIAILPHRVIERHDRAAGDAEYDFDILADERLAHYLRACALVGHLLTPALGL